MKPLITISMTVFPALALAQSAPSPSSIGAEVVELMVTVTDRKGQPVPDLEVGDLTLVENGAPRMIESLEVATGEPLTIGLLVDLSGSMTDHVDRMSADLHRFLVRVTRPGDAYFAAGFAEKPDILVPLGLDLLALPKAMASLRPQGATAFYDALGFALDQFRDLRGRKVLLVISDGFDTSSELRLREILDAIGSESPAIYPLLLGRAPPPIRGVTGQLAARSGGRLHLVPRPALLDGALQSVGSDLQAQFLLAYSRPAIDATTDRYRIRLKARRGLRARTLQEFGP